MGRPNAKTVFSREEMKAIKDLVSILPHTERTKQKSIRQKIRRIGLYWSEVAEHRTPYTLENLEKFISQGRIKVTD